MVTKAKARRGKQSDGKQTIVISLGGSLIAPKEKPVDTEFLSKFKKTILSFVKKGKRFVICCGGGSPAREWQKAARRTNPKIGSVDLDWVGIMATRMNAELVRAAFGKDAHHEVLHRPDLRAKSERNIIIAAGWHPGRSTDYDAVALAKTYGAGRVINMSNVKHVYDKDPREHRDAKRFDSLSWKGYRKISGSKWKPGINLPFDPVASAEAQKNHLTVVILGKDLGNFSKCVTGAKYVGTTIKN